MDGRKKPYTARGIVRKRCVRCGEQAMYQWQICADGNTYRPICGDCDVKLNELVLCWMGFPDWQEKIKGYRNEA